MTEGDWLTSPHPGPLLRYLGDTASPRKLRLFACAWAADQWTERMGAAVLNALGVAKAFADGETDAAELAAAHAQVLLLAAGEQSGPGRVMQVIRAAVNPTLRAADLAALAGPEHQANYPAAMQLRDLFGNPFCPPPFDPRWRTSDVVDVARGIYADQAFDRLPILIDALMDAGCEDRDVFAHFRRVPPHARGCYLLDLLLGKE